MIDVIVCGCRGKMGREVIQCSKGFENLRIAGGIDRNGEKCEEFPIFISPSDVNIKCDVVIDFSGISALEPLLECCQKRNISLVLCVTGYSKEQHDIIRNAAKNIAVFVSSNMSFAVNLMASLARLAKSVLGKRFDVEIIEKHHRNKIDAPSGTALMLAESVSENGTQIVFDRHERGARKSNEIGISSVRGGDIPGEHEIIFAGEGETLTLCHVATDRKIFAQGALEAAVFLQNQKPGLYNYENFFHNSLDSSVLV
ncbi:MAG: 4-hydroxy-tetrahydrodipicolinate reductase [Oscillospiraceae bacterium]|jgi:4-hydroxy-tetrahydrodipicolinate reductase|nr:4-hydroxy-tetrahydrodipicolinate reductase [Oscillospiraceae bacterium]